MKQTELIFTVVALEGSTSPLRITLSAAYIQHYLDCYQLLIRSPVQMDAIMTACDNAVLIDPAFPFTIPNHRTLTIAEVERTPTHKIETGRAHCFISKRGVYFQLRLSKSSYYTKVIPIDYFAEFIYFNEGTTYIASLFGLENDCMVWKKEGQYFAGVSNPHSGEVFKGEYVADVLEQVRAYNLRTVKQEWSLV